MLEAKQSGNVVEDFTIGNTRIKILPDPDERRGQRNPRPRRTEDSWLAHGSRHT